MRLYYCCKLQLNIQQRTLLHVMWPEDETKIAGRYQRSGHHLNTTTTDLKQIEMISFEKHELAQPSQKDCFGVAGSQFCMDSWILSTQTARKRFVEGGGRYLGEKGRPPSQKSCVVKLRLTSFCRITRPYLIPRETDTLMSPLIS